MKWAIAVAVFLAFMSTAESQRARAAQSEGSHSAAYQSAQRKLNEIAENGRLARPQSKTTVLTAAEIDAYLAEGGVALPDGVQRVRFSSVPAVVTAAARIDFDRLTASRRVNNPWMALLFTGAHDVYVEAQATGSGGVGSVRIESVTLDGVKVPRAAMQFLVDNYLRPRYGPNVGLDSRFPLPAHIDVAAVGNNQVAVTQR